jgi:hypothetical protein
MVMTAGTLACYGGPLRRRTAPWIGSFLGYGSNTLTDLKAPVSGQPRRFSTGRAYFCAERRNPIFIAFCGRPAPV